MILNYYNNNGVAHISVDDGYLRYYNENIVGLKLPLCRKKIPFKKTHIYNHLYEKLLLKCIADHRLVMGISSKLIRNDISADLVLKREEDSKS